MINNNLVYVNTFLQCSLVILLLVWKGFTMWTCTYCNIKILWVQCPSTEQSHTPMCCSTTITVYMWKNIRLCSCLVWKEAVTWVVVIFMFKGQWLNIFCINSLHSSPRLSDCLSDGDRVDSCYNVSEKRFIIIIKSFM